MKERPILFSGPMVRAILAGTKTQTRRPVKPQPEMIQDGEILADGSGGYSWELVWPEGHKWWGRPLGGCCPFGKPGDRLWVRETWAGLKMPNESIIAYRASCEGDEFIYHYENEVESIKVLKWSPSIHMPRWACRLVLEIVSVRVERLQQISEEDALAEGVSLAWYSREHDIDGFYESYREAFQDAWNPIYAAKGQGWDANPWVWVVEFKRAEGAHV